MKKIAFLAVMFAGFSHATMLYFSYIPSSVNPGDTFDVQVIAAPATGEQINLFSIDLEFSSILTVTAVNEDGYFLANGAAWSPGSPGSTGSPDTSLLAGISDILYPGDYLPSTDTLFDVAFIATGAGSPAVTLGSGSYLQDPNYNPIPIDGVTYLTPEPSSALLGFSGIAILAVFARRRRW
jgi:hypothetical protein